MYLNVWAELKFTKTTEKNIIFSLLLLKNLNKATHELAQDRGFILISIVKIVLTNLMSDKHATGSIIVAKIAMIMKLKMKNNRKESSSFFMNFMTSSTYLFLPSASFDCDKKNSRYSSEFAPAFQCK